MATVNDIGTPGSPLSTPPLTAWQAAVRDAINASVESWQAWTPAITGGTTSSASCFYHRTRGGLVTVSIHLTMATVTGNLTVSVPVAALTPGKDVLPALLTDTGTSHYDGLATVTSAGVATVYAAGGTGGALRALAAAVPYTWAAGDMIDISGSYRAAAAP